MKSNHVFSRLLIVVLNQFCNDFAHFISPQDSDIIPSYFMYILSMAVIVFLQEKVDVAVIEVGIGGAFDRTNVISKPVVCGVTSLGLDHLNLLGSTIEEIAWHKGGIFKVRFIQRNYNALNTILLFELFLEVLYEYFEEKSETFTEF